MHPTAAGQFPVLCTEIRAYHGCGCVSRLRVCVTAVCVCHGRVCVSRLCVQLPGGSMNPSPAVPGAAPAGAAAAAAAGTPGKPSGWAAGKTVRWSKPPIGDTSCCCRPLTGAPYLRPGPHAGHGCSEAFGQGRHRTFRPSIQLGVASSLFSAHLHSLSMDESLSVSLLFVVAFARVLPALLNPRGFP